MSIIMKIVKLIIEFVYSSFDLNLVNGLMSVLETKRLIWMEKKPFLSCLKKLKILIGFLSV